MTWLLIMLATQLSDEALRERALFGRAAQADLITFARLTSPLAADHLNPWATKYDAQPYHEYIARHLEQFAEAKINRLMIALPYRHGKSELAVRKLVPWLVGRNPDKGGIVVTHTDSLAREHGRDCREIMRGAGYRLTFGNGAAQLREDSQAQDRLQVAGGATVLFSGRRGMGGGFGAQWIIFDDFFKNSEEARSQAVRDHAYETFISDCKSRLNEHTGGVILIGTRKHEDDPQGRILDPRNPHYDAREAQRWTVIRLPALAEDGDPLGRQKDEALWPARFPYEFWNDQRTHQSELVRMDFETQGQCNPRPAQGTYFKAEWLVPYGPDDLPKELRIYVASDHAIKEKDENDATVMPEVGMDVNGDLWVLPTCWWDRKPTDVVVEAMIETMRRRKPVAWFAPKDQITGSIGPFLRREMREKQVYVAIHELSDVKDKQAKAQAIQGRMACRRVHFPVFATWWSDAANELLSFPNGTHDDFVDALANIGRGLEYLLLAEGEKKDNRPPRGTLAWVKESAKRREQQEAAASVVKGW